jgi:hypothetical protein
MKEQMSLFKGELMEEKLRLYFLNSGYFVVRGAKYNHKNHEITDIDILLYGRLSSLTRERINVDLKNKKSPKAFERILWAKGLQELLHFENCIVATMDNRDIIREYGRKHKVIVLDGNFLQKLPYDNAYRITEEDLIAKLADFRDYSNKDSPTWKTVYEESKSRLLNQMDFSGFNSTLLTLKFFVKSCFDKQKCEVALRCTYLILSHALIILDYILKDVVILEPNLRKETLSDGFKYGNLGREGMIRTIEMAIKITDSSKNISSLRKILDSEDSDILRDYFSRNEVSKKIFSWAIELERQAFKKHILIPELLDPDLRSTLFIFLDYFDIGRKEFFGLYNNLQQNNQSSDKLENI